MKAVMAAKKAAQKAKALKARGAAVAAKGQALADKGQAALEKGQAFAAKGQAVVAQGQAALLPVTEEVMTLNIPAPIQPRINQVPQPILSQPVIKSEPTINMSELTVVRDPELVSVVNKLKTGKIETEIGYPQVGLTILLGIFFVAVTALGIDKYNKCVGIQGPQKVPKP